MKKIKIIEDGVLKRNTMSKIQGGATCTMFGISCKRNFIDEQCFMYTTCDGSYSTCQSDNNFSIPCGLDAKSYSSKRPEIFKIRF